MESTEFEIMYHVEDDHWWYRGMMVINRSLINRWIPLQKNARILDAGCGTGAAMQTLLSNKGWVAGLDLTFQALTFCQQRGVHTLSCGSVGELPYASQSFDLITNFDVLYARSVPDVEAALREFERVLVPGGHLLLRVPAYDWLRGYHDTAIGTARRFTLKTITRLIQGSGLTIKHRSYANTFLFPLALLKRMLERPVSAHTKPSELTIRFGLFDKIFGFILGLEAPLVARTTLPFGLSVVIVAQK